MFANLKALVVVLTLASIAFSVAKPTCLRFMSLATFIRRRNVWIGLTAVAFISPSFWLYAAIALPTLAWATKKDENPLALYVLSAFIIPNFSLYIPIVGINQLFDLSHYRILSFSILIPVALRVTGNRDGASARPGWLDLSVAAFLVLQVLLYIPYESITNTMRRAFLLGLDSFLVIFVFSRVTSIEKLKDIIASFWLCCLILAPIGIFESLRGWLLYEGLSFSWDAPMPFAYLMRGNELRAQASAFHSINLGYILAMGLACHLYVQSFVPRVFLRYAILVLLCAGMFVTYSRGAWTTAMLMALLFALLRPGFVRRIGVYGGIAAMAALVGSLTPVGQSFIDKLPFVGSAYQDTIDYRQELAEISWALIKQNPWFGDPFVTDQMESLRQGQGIIDIVNGYIFIALFNGIVGVALFVSTFIIGLIYSIPAFLIVRRESGELGVIYATLASALLASLFFIATAGYGVTQYIIVGLLVSLSSLVRKYFIDNAKSRQNHYVGGVIYTR